MFVCRFIAIICLLFCISCANIQTISGGPEDKAPPVVLESDSSPNFQTNFKEREIILTFDEWIRIDNPSVNISISPSTEFPPEYKLKGKKLIVLFDKREVLKENTTYSIQFGESIKDISAGNTQLSLRYVFSTGPYLDSLSIEGKVVDALSKKAKAKVLISLYKLLDDTAFQKTKPFYFNWTDTAGKFSLKNLSAGTYRLFALEDKNLNYYYDQVNEAFAFYPEHIIIKDTIVQSYTLNLSAKTPPGFIKSRKLLSGETRLYFNEKQYTLELNCDSSHAIKFVNLNDSILIWNTQKTDVNCILNYSNKKDTFLVKADSLLVTNSLKQIQLVKPLVNPGESPTFIFPAPLIQIIIDSIQSIDSISLIRSYRLDSTDPRKFYIDGRFSNLNQNKIVIKQGAVAGIHHTKNQTDTFLFRFLDKSAVARLNLDLDGLQPGVNYILQIVSGESVNESLDFATTGSSKKLLFHHLLPGKYRARLIEDRNKNGQWNAADYENKIQPETVWYFELPDLRADWDIDVKLNIK